MRQRCVTHQKLEHRKRWAEHCKGAVLIPVGIDVAVVNGPRRVAGLVSRDTCMKRGRQTDRLRDRIEGCEHTRVSPPLLSPLPPSLSFAATHSHSLTHSLTHSPTLSHSPTLTRIHTQNTLFVTWADQAIGRARRGRSAAPLRSQSLMMQQVGKKKTR